MDNKEALELDARELWNQAHTIKQMAEVNLEVAKSLIGEPKESAKLKLEAVKLLKEYLALRQKANDLFKQAEFPAQQKIKAVK